MFKIQLLKDQLNDPNPLMADVLDAVTSGADPKEIDVLINILRTAIQYQHMHDTAVYVNDCARIETPADTSREDRVLRRVAAAPMALLSALNCEPPRQVGGHWTCWTNDVIINATEYSPEHLTRTMPKPFRHGALKDIMPPARGFSNKALIATIAILEELKDDADSPYSALVNNNVLNDTAADSPALSESFGSTAVRQFSFFDRTHYFKRMQRYLGAERITTLAPPDNPKERAANAIKHVLLYEALVYAREANTPKSDVQRHEEQTTRTAGLSTAKAEAVVKGLRRIMQAVDTETVLWRVLQLRREVGPLIKYIHTEESQLTIATLSRRAITLHLAKLLIAGEALSIIPERLIAGTLASRTERARRLKAVPERRTVEAVTVRKDKYTAATLDFEYNPETGALIRKADGTPVIGRSANIRHGSNNLSKTTLVKYCIVAQGFLPDDFAHLTAEDINMRLDNPELDYPERTRWTNLNFSYRYTPAVNQRMPTAAGLLQAHNDARAARLVRYDETTGHIHYRERHDKRKLGTGAYVYIDGYRINRNRLLIYCIAQERRLSRGLPDTVKAPILTVHNAHLMRFRNMPYTGDALPTPDTFAIEVDPRYEQWYKKTKGDKLPSYTDLAAYRHEHHGKGEDERVRDAEKDELLTDTGSDLEAFHAWQTAHAPRKEPITDCPLV